MKHEKISKKFFVHEKIPKEFPVSQKNQRFFSGSKKSRSDFLGLKKSQITMFILMGIIILLIFGLLYYMAGLQKKVKTQAQIEKMTADILKAEEITRYTTLCLDSTLQKGLILLGQQGGYIFKDQPGSIIHFPIDHALYDNISIAYLITHKDYARFPPPPAYPCSDTYSSPGSWYCNFTNNITQFPDLYTYSYGKNELPSLYGLFSIQRQLESYLTYNTKKCTNFTALLHLPELAGYHITEGTLKADLRFAENEVSVILTYPITFALHGYEPVTHLLRFFSKANVRFSTIYEAVNDMIAKDNQYLDYDMLEDTENGGNYSIPQADGSITTKPIGFDKLKDKATLEEHVIPDGSIFIINDSASQINAQPYIFQFARKNRPPVLDYIPNIIMHLKDDVITELIPFKATDPDEDPIDDDYIGWEDEIAPYLIATSSDIGYHNITVYAFDGPIPDYQDVTILVCGANNVGKLPDTCLEACGASSECENKSFGYKLAPNLGCNATCQFVNCSNYAFNSTLQRCILPDQAKSSADCAPDRIFIKELGRCFS